MIQSKDSSPHQEIGVGTGKVTELKCHGAFVAKNLFKHGRNKVPVVLRLQRCGAKKKPSYRIVAAESCDRREGDVLDFLGFYKPTQPRVLELKKEKILEWIKKGAKPSNVVKAILRESLKNKGFGGDGNLSKEEKIQKTDEMQTSETLTTSESTEAITSEPSTPEETAKQDIG